MQDETAILLEQERQQRVQELLEMRERDNSFGVERYQVENPLLEINKRIIEYVSILQYTLEFLLLQTIQDFKSYYIVLQNKKLDYSKPVLILRNEQHSKVYVNKEITKEQIRITLNSDGMGVATIAERDNLVAEKLICFVREEFYSP